MAQSINLWSSNECHRLLLEMKSSTENGWWVLGLGFMVSKERALKSVLCILAIAETRRGLAIFLKSEKSSENVECSGLSPVTPEHGTLKIGSSANVECSGLWIFKKPYLMTRA